jgi:hypothetical protein
VVVANNLKTNVVAENISDGVATSHGCVRVDVVAGATVIRDHVAIRSGSLLALGASHLALHGRSLYGDARTF